LFGARSTNSAPTEPNHADKGIEAIKTDAPGATVEDKTG
jgi:hypothetical protein